MLMTSLALRQIAVCNLTHTAYLARTHAQHSLTIITYTLSGGYLDAPSRSVTSFKPVTLAPNIFKYPSRIVGMTQMALITNDSNEVNRHQDCCRAWEESSLLRDKYTHKLQLSVVCCLWLALERTVLYCAHCCCSSLISIVVKWA